MPRDTPSALCTALAEADPAPHKCSRTAISRSPRGRRRVDIMCFIFGVLRYIGISNKNSVSPNKHGLSIGILSMKSILQVADFQPVKVTCLGSLWLTPSHHPTHHLTWV